MDGASALHITGVVGAAFSGANFILLVTLAYKVGRWQGGVDRTLVDHERRLNSWNGEKRRHTDAQAH